MLPVLQRCCSAYIIDTTLTALFEYELRTKVPAQACCGLSSSFTRAWSILPGTMRSPPAAQRGLMSCSTLFGAGLERTNPDVTAAGTAIAVDQVCWYGMSIARSPRLALPNTSAAASGTYSVCTFSAPSDFFEEWLHTNGVPTQNQVNHLQCLPNSTWVSYTSHRELNLEQTYRNLLAQAE